MTGAVPVDWELTDSYFVVGHIHYVLIGWNLFAVKGAIYFWLPKMTGRLLDERLGRWNFWTMFVGFNLGFFPMHISGSWECHAASIPIRTRWDGTFKNGAVAGNNPWDSPRLEWATPSPPPPYNFAVIPTVATHHPLWEDRLGGELIGQRAQLMSSLISAST